MAIIQSSRNWAMLSMLSMLSMKWPALNRNICYTTIRLLKTSRGECAKLLYLHLSLITLRILVLTPFDMN